MVDYREILRLQSLGHNITQIAASLHSSRNTVREVERLADEKGIRWPLGEEVTNPQLYLLLYPERQEIAKVYLEPDCAWMLMLSWVVMISPCHAVMRLPGYLSWNVPFDGAAVRPITKGISSYIHALPAL